MNPYRVAMALIVVALIALGIYEILQVRKVNAATPEIIAAAHAEMGPQVMLPQDWTDALLMVEDPHFAQHHGVDFMTPGQGGTTITQVLAARLYADQTTPLLAGFEHGLFATIVLDARISKEEQLALYEGLVDLGAVHGQAIHGFGNGARAYFGKPLNRLSKHQFLQLVAMEMSPTQLDPREHAQANAERTARIERLLAHQCKPRDHDDVWLVDCRSPA